MPTYNESMTKFDTSPYAYDGYDIDPYNAFDNLVDQDSGFDVEDFNEPDSIFGLGNKKKQAERKLKRAERKLSKGKTKAAERLQKKAGKILDKISTGQQQQLGMIQKQADINVTQQNIAQAREQAGNVIADAQEYYPTSLSEQPMSDIASSIGPSMQDYTSGVGGGGGGSIPDFTQDLSGAESTASDEPTGQLAQEKTLGNVTVTASKSKRSFQKTLPFIIIGAVILIVGVIYFIRKKK